MVVKTLIILNAIIINYTVSKINCRIFVMLGDRQQMVMQYMVLILNTILIYSKLKKKKTLLSFPKSHSVNKLGLAKHSKTRLVSKHKNKKTKLNSWEICFTKCINLCFFPYPYHKK